MNCFDELEVKSLLGVFCTNGCVLQLVGFLLGLSSVFPQIGFVDAAVKSLNFLVFVHDQQVAWLALNLVEVNSGERNLESPEHDQVLRTGELEQEERVLDVRRLRTHQDVELVFTDRVCLNLGHTVEVQVPPVLRVVTSELPDFNATASRESSNVSKRTLEYNLRSFFK